MRVECGIIDGKVQVPQSWLEKWKQETGEEPDTVVFDLSDASAKVPAGVFLAVREPSDKVKAIKIRSQLHAIRHNTMSGYRTICGKTASFGHQVYHPKVENITCQECVRKAVIRKERR